MCVPPEKRKDVIGHQWVRIAVQALFLSIEFAIVQARETSTEVLAASQSISRKIGKIAVVAGVCFGFLGNRILFQRQREANRLVVEDGVAPWEVDRVLLGFGFPNEFLRAAVTFNIS
jgi:3-hydroxyacyl-CoA dehydrogenase